MEKNPASYLQQSVSVNAPAPELPKSTQNLLSEKRMQELWTRMADIYGYRWVSQYGEADECGTWMRGLGDLSGPQIAEGLRMCVRVGEVRARLGEDDWPPTLGQFRGYCKTQREAVYIGTKYVAIEKSDMTEEQKRQAIDSCRNALKP